MQRRRSDPAHLVQSARALFVRYGVKKTSMEDVAREAGVAKGTVYLAFASKDALFRAVCVDVCEELEQRSAAAVEGVAQPAERVVRRLEAKYGFLHELLAASPHAAELLQSKDSLARDVLQQLEERFKATLAADLELLGPGAEAPAEGAAMLVRLARGCAQPDEGEALPSAEEVRRRVGRAARTLLAGLFPPGRLPRPASGAFLPAKPA